MHRIGRERWGGGEHDDAEWRETELASRCEATHRIELHGVSTLGARREAGGGAELVARGYLVATSGKLQL